MLLDGRVDGLEALGEGGAADAVETRLRGDDLDDNQSGAGWLRENDLEILNGDGRGHGHDPYLNEWLVTGPLTSGYQQYSGA